MSREFNNLNELVEFVVKETRLQLKEKRKRPDRPDRFVLDIIGDNKNGSSS
jgi:hypothetical protein